MLGQWAWIRNHIDLTVTPPDGEPMHRSGYTLSILEKGSEGRWRLETIVPAVYPGRTRHIHVKVQPAGGRLLTTQLYFPHEPENARDGLFRDELVLRMSGREQGAFDFVVA